MRSFTLAFLAAGLALLAAGASTLVAAAPKIENSMAQRVLACTGCHGAQGRAASDGYYPRIAGKPPEYLYRQLLNFRDARRIYPLMTGLIDPLSETYLREIAEHFASVDLPYVPPSPSRSNPESMRRGEELARRGSPTLPACAACHGSALTGVWPSIPGLVGLPRDYLAAQLGAWKIGERRALAPDCMAHVVQLLGAGDIAAVSDWLAAQPVPTPAKAASGLPAPLPVACGAAPELGGPK